jgi:hypothetical protein
VEFLTTKKIAAGIEDIIKNANTRIFLISPYIKLSKEYIEWLEEAVERDVDIVIIYGKQKDIEENTRKALEGLGNITVKYYEHLHSKCYMNESFAIVSSMNLYDFSERNNREMGISIFRKEDSEIFSKIFIEIRSLIRISKNINFIPRQSGINHFFSDLETTRKRDKSSSTKRKSIKFALDGFCIRCGDEIPLEPSRPLCDDCYETWSIFYNFDYEENFCHVCGEESDVNFRKPLCFSCYRHSDI